VTGAAATAALQGSLYPTSTASWHSLRAPRRRGRDEARFSCARPGRRVSE
jgi:hypothetical protein